MATYLPMKFTVNSRTNSNSAKFYYAFLMIFVIGKLEFRRNETSYLNLTDVLDCIIRQREAEKFILYYGNVELSKLVSKRASEVDKFSK